MEILSTALQGLNNAGTRFDQAAARVTEASLPQTQTAGSESDLAQEIVHLNMSRVEYLANLKVAQAGSDMTRHTLDILA